MMSSVGFVNSVENYLKDVTVKPALGERGVGSSPTSTAGLIERPHDGREVGPNELGKVRLKDIAEM